MTSILSWNIQNGIGCDGEISLSRIADVIGKMGEPDVICLQEVSRDLALLDNLEGPDQAVELAELFPDYEVVFGAAIEACDTATGHRWQFGNALLSRAPILSVARHLLPRPAVPDTRYMTRQATEAVVKTPDGELRVINTHLEFHSQVQKFAQIERLREIQTEITAEQSEPRQVDFTGPYQEVSRPLETILCGDFNFLSGSVEYQKMLAPLGTTGHRFQDAWAVAYPDQPHESTCGIYDRELWPEGPHCRDFFFTVGIDHRRIHGVVVNTETDASDHQPLILTLG